MSRSRARRDEEKEQRREAILDAAQVVFTSQGFEAAKMEDVAREARVSRALVYLYFKNKDDLYFGICVRALNLLRERFEAVRRRPGTGLDQIEGIGRAYMQFADELPCHFMALSRFEAHHPEDLAPGSAERAVLDAGKAVHAVTVAALQQGMRDGSIRDDLDKPLLVAMTLWGFTHGTIQLAKTKAHFFAEAGVPVSDLMDKATELALQSLKPRAVTAPTRRRKT